MTPEAHEHEHAHDHPGELARIEAIRDQGVHRITEHEGPFSLHLVGIGRAGASIITQLLRDRPQGFLSDPRTRFTALAVDIGDQELRPVRDAAAGLPAEQSQVRTVSLPVPAREEVFSGLRRYREFLKMEFPRYYWNPNYEPWLPSDMDLPEAGAHFDRAVAKAIYGLSYYQDGEIARELEAFARSIDASPSTSIVCVLVGLGGGTGSGIVVELARHLSSIKLGRRAWVVGIGVLPCDGDPPETRDGRMFPVINELDCMIDTEKNKGVMAVWGDLYKNPFTGGFFAVPQNEIFHLTRDLAGTHEYVNEGIVNFLARDGSKHLYETLKLLNWLSVPADRWHPAIRGEPTDRWINLLTWRRPEHAATLGSTEIHDGLKTEYVEARAFGASATSDAAIRSSITGKIQPTIEPGVLRFDADTAPGVSLCVPHVSKLDLTTFVPTREAYDKLEWDGKLLRHAWLLDLGVLLCEPSIRFEGMGGECIWGCACWVVVPHAAIRGEVRVPAMVGV